MPVLLTWSGPGPCSTAPTRTGTPMSRTASSISAPAPGSRNGSMSEAFSGQMTRSGRATSPARTSAASRWVASTWFRSTCSRSPWKSSPTPGTSPCTSATVTGRPSPAPTGSSSPATGTARASSASTAAGRQAGQAQDRRREQRSGKGGHEGHQRGTTDRGVGREGRRGLGERQPPPREAPEGRRVAGQLLRDPQAGHPDRPPRQPQHGRRAAHRRGRGTTPPAGPPPATHRGR